MTRIIPVIRGFFFSPISDISFPYRVNQTFALACEILANVSFPPVVARINSIDRTRNGSCSSPALHGKYWIFLARRSRAMIMTNKLLPVALIAALIGGSVGALVMHKSQPAAAETPTGLRKRMSNPRLARYLKQRACQGISRFSSSSGPG